MNPWHDVGPENKQVRVERFMGRFDAVIIERSIQLYADLRHTLQAENPPDPSYRSP
jgi:hypothetical protein